MFDFTPNTPPAETKPDSFTLESLYAWLRAQPPEREYDYWNVHNCLICQYGAAHFGTDIYHEVANMMDHSSQYSEFVEIAAASPHTFGAAANRCRAAMERGA